MNGLDDLNLDASRENRNYVRRDPNLDVTDDLHKNDDHPSELHLDDHDLGDPRRNVAHDPNLGEMDGNHDRHKNDLRLDAKNPDVIRNFRRANRKCAPRARNDLSLGAKKMGDQSMNCDLLSHDHLPCDHQMLRRRGMNLSSDAKLMIHRVMKKDAKNYRGMGDQTRLTHAMANYCRANLMMGDQKMAAKNVIQKRNYGHLDGPVNGTMNYLQAWLLLFLKLG